MPEEKLSREEAERLEQEIEQRARERIKQAILELLKENPKEIYAAVVEVIGHFRRDADEQIGTRIRRLFTGLLIFAILGLAVIGYVWTTWTKH